MFIKTYQIHNESSVKIMQAHVSLNQELNKDILKTIVLGFLWATEQAI